MTSVSSGAVRPLLFDAVPTLAHRVPWIPLIEGPTPVQLLDRVSGRVGREIWIKRDDRTSPVYGGNKPRKLEFLLAEARIQDARTLVTGGALGTNHGLATTIFGRRLGFHVVLCLLDQPVTDHVLRNLLLFHAYGAEMVYVGSKLRGAVQFGLVERIRRRRACFIPLGGSSPTGVLGFVNAGLELALQLERKELPPPSSIFVAVGSCGTMAGLVLGFRVAGVSVPVVGVQVAPRLVVNPGAVLRLARRTQRLMGRHGGRVSGKPLSVSDFPIDRAHYGSGYGHTTEKGRSAIRLMAEAEGILLEPTYTAKTFAAVLDHRKTESRGGPVLFWNTFNSVDLSAQAGLVDSTSLPKAFHGFFQARKTGSQESVNADSGRKSFKNL